MKSSLKSLKKTKNLATIFLLVLILIPCLIFSQDNVEFKGRIIDSETKNPLALADLVVSNTNISTVTNSDGEFLLKVPENKLENTLIISHLGYKKQAIKLTNLKTKKNTIKLKASATVLTQININIPINAEALVRKALNKKGENYLNNQTLMTGFYRETIKKRNKNASLSEAVVKINKQPYSSSKKDAIHLIKSRKNTNYSRLDTLALKLQGGPFSNLYTDVMKYPEFIFTKNNISWYQFQFKKSTQINNKLVYVIHFKQQPNITDCLYYGHIFIDAETEAVTSIVYNLNVENRTKASKLFVRKKPKKAKVYPTEASYRVNYRIKDGKWYYAYSNIALTFKVKWKQRLFNTRYTLQSELAITDWETTTTNTLNIKNKLSPTMILADETSGFLDPDFWGKYNIIEPEKSIETAIKKINKQLKKSLI